ncbi:MAG TPA: PTS sugar transporter subunit IIC [Myxococcales bacterium]|nr:PTS sugar transporter subunit IIC [Myxococcales bacterium]
MDALPGGAWGLLLAAVAAALIGGLAAIERKGALQLMLSRPIVLSPLLGWALGDAEGGLFLGIPLELIFLGGVNLGGSLPDNETLLAAAVTSAVVPAGIIARTGVDAALSALALALLYPLARAGRLFERAAELKNAALSDRALERAAGGDAGAAWLNLRGLLLPFAVTASVCLVCTLLSPALAIARSAAPPRLVSGLEGAWHAVWALGAATAIRAIRDPRGPALAALGFGAVLATAALIRALP